MNQLIEQEITQINQQSFEINSKEDLVKINTVLKGVKLLKKKVEDELNPRIEEANKTHKGLTTLKNKYLDPLKSVESKINLAIKVWTLKQEAEAKALQEKINKDLSDRAEALRLEKIKNAENKDEWSKEIAIEEANAMVTDSVSLEACKEAVITKTEGQYKRSNWKARVTNAMLVPREYLIVDEQALNKIAKASKLENGEVICNIPGVEFYDDFTIVTKV